MDPELARTVDAHVVESDDDASDSTSRTAPRPRDEADIIRMFHDLIHGLREQIALVDEHWNLLTFNDPWAEAVRQWGYSDLDCGANYRQFCERRAAEGHPAGAMAIEAIADIEAGQNCVAFSYHGSGPGEGRDFELRLHRLQLCGRTFTTVTRYDVTELVELREARARFNQSVVEEQLAERRRMAREIHDSTAQLLACIGLGLGQLKRSVEEAAPLRVVSELEDLLVETQREIRSISYLAHPPELEKLGLAEALRRLSAGFASRTGLDIAFDVEEGFRAPSKDAELSVYRIVQEALSNVHRHSHAGHAQVRLINRGSAIHAVIGDDGVGFTADASTGVGLVGMRARLSDFHGRLTVRSKAGSTVIVASLLNADPH